VKSTQPNPVETRAFALAFVLALAVIAVPPIQAQTFKVVHNFTGTSDGGNPLDGFVADTSGNLYGTTSAGGNSGNGAVIEFSKAGVESVLYSFAGGTDGSSPQAGLLRDKSGNLYGTTYAGGAEGTGTIFKIPAGGTEQVLYSFAGGKDAAYPEAGLIMDAQGNLYGTASAGGTYNNGAVFRLTPPKTGSMWKETLLYSFGGTGTDGQAPVASVILGAAGTLYGTTSTGGEYGYGTIYELARSGASWEETILHNFADGDDGGIPYGGLIADKAGNFYGAATEGGTGGGGTIFELTPSNGSWTFAVLYSNPGWGISGSFRNLLLDASGNLYGTTHCDGADSAGTVYKLTPASGSWTYTSLYSFTGGSDGLYVYSNPVMLQGRIYGTTKLGGANGYGVIWQVIP
jgi:uncharacterized repeat protein (TIGR03803 family)